MVKQRAYNKGSIFGFIYEFGEKGDEIKWHNHLTYNNPHSVIVIKGTVAIEERGKESKLVCGGDMPYETPDPAVEHTIRAVCAKTIILNLYYNGKPEDWVDGYVGSL